MNNLKAIILIVILFIATPFTMALARLSGLSEFSEHLIGVIGFLIFCAIALIRTEKH
jgi:hypothetical protein